MDRLFRTVAGVGKILMVAVAALAVVERDPKVVGRISGVRDVAGDGVQTAAAAVALPIADLEGESTMGDLAGESTMADLAGESAMGDIARESPMADLAGESAESWCRAWTSLIGYDHPLAGCTYC
jgi:hypothetical protein